MPTGSKRPIQRPCIPRLDSDELHENSLKHKQQDGAAGVQDRQTDAINLSNNASMHDSGSSFKDVGLNKDKLYESVKGERRPVPESIDTQPVEE